MFHRRVARVTLKWLSFGSRPGQLQSNSLLPKFVYSQPTSWMASCRRWHLPPSDAWRYRYWNSKWNTRNKSCKTPFTGDNAASSPTPVQVQVQSMDAGREGVGTEHCVLEKRGTSNVWVNRRRGYLCAWSLHGVAPQRMVAFRAPPLPFAELATTVQSFWTEASRDIMPPP